MSFLAPWRLAWLGAIPALVAAYLVLQRRRRSYVVQFTNLELLATVAPRRPGWRRHAAPLLMLLELVALLVAFARPAVWARVPRRQSAIVLVMDVSRSMMATDLAPDRITAAKRAALAFVDAVPPRHQLAVVAFSDRAELVSPLGAERDRTREAIRSLQPLGGTALGDGVSLAVDEIERARRAAPRLPAAILLLSDGAANRGLPPSQAAARAAAAGVKVYAVGVGTPGATLQLFGRSIPVDLDEAELRGIAEATGGAYFRTADAGALRAVYRDLGSALGYVRRPREVTASAAGAGAALLVAAAAASLLWFQRLP